MNLYPGQWRLARIELANWGTFDGFHAVDVPREGFLITGGSGSGKSTLLDGVSAVLTPRGKTRFNAAAATDGTRSGGRNHLTYVRGAWRKVADEDTGEVASSFLRKGATWSGVLLQYTNSLGAVTTLAKLFHVKSNASAVSDVKELGIVYGGAASLLEMQEYAVRGLDAKGLRRAFPKASVEAEHSAFERRFTRALGLVGDRATMLLHKTQSAKNMRSLDELFRGFMLDEPETFAIAQHAVEQFAELDAAHKTVVKAKEQVKALEPLRDADAQYKNASDQAERAQCLLDSLDDYVHGRRLELSRQSLQTNASELDHATLNLAQADAAVASAERKVEEFKALVDQNGGSKIAVLESQVAAARTLHAKVAAQFEQLKRQLSRVQWMAPSSAAEFTDLVALCRAEIENNAENMAKLDRQLEQEVTVQMAAAQKLKEVAAELESMKGSQSNFNHRLLAVRKLVAENTGLKIKDLPFAGELLQVKSEYADWTGAIERVLKPLSLNMLVPASHEKAVTAVVDKLNLGTKLNILVVRRQVDAPAANLVQDSLVYRVQVAEHPFEQWLHHRLAERFDFACVETPVELNKVQRGVTKSGQVKRGIGVYEKDDRFRVNDRREWVMGFDNQERFEGFLQEQSEARKELEAAMKLVQEVNNRRNLESSRYQVACDVADQLWESVDAASAQRAVDDLMRSLATLLADDKNLGRAQEQLASARAALAGAQKTRATANDSVVLLHSLVTQLTSTVAELEADTSVKPVDGKTVAALQREFSGVKRTRAVSHETLDTDAMAVQRSLSKQQREHSEAMHGYATKMSKTISRFHMLWPEANPDLTGELADRAGYLTILDQLVADRLPEFETRFYDLMRDQTQQNFAGIREAISQGIAQIKHRIEVVNESLTGSEYAPGTTLQIRVKDSKPAVAMEFLKDLNRVTTGAFSPNEDREASDQRFEVIAEMMSKLSSSEPAAKTWRQHCLDVRGHVHFTAVELDELGSEVNFYESTESLSGGQGQKLLAFCLASALRYQLTTDQSMPNYGSIIMDEAFDKTDDVNTRAALDVYNQFGFHMILANPLKSLGALEDYIGGLVYVSCKDGKASKLSVMTYEEANATLAVAS